MRLLLIVVLLTAGSVLAQQPQRQDSSLFDFWIGEWDLTWKDPDGSTATGSNSITKILDGKVIHENFAALTGQSKGYKGNSVSILEQRTGRWKQSWVDNQNGYFSFTGGAEGEQRYFEHEFMKEGALHKGKMIFRNITRNSLVWDWMKSTDGGKSWTVQWSINYQRKK